MTIDLVICEIGSTTTIVNAFNDIKSDNPQYLGQGFYKTTVEEGDVSIGVKNALTNLAKNLKVKQLTYKELMATSSAAGGLKMSVHGLVHDMTVNAANEAALGAGGNVQFVTSGKLRASDIAQIIKNKPNIILLAGGVDYGERETALHNAKLISETSLKIPVIYAGNIENQEEIKQIFQKALVKKELFIVENVFPRLDEINIEPTKKIIHHVFSKHIVHAQGMSKIFDLVTYKEILPTPGAVMESTILLNEIIGDVLTIDIGGATTDIHSSTNGDENLQQFLINPEPKNKRTVEGDLGVYVNRFYVYKNIDHDQLLANLNVTKTELDSQLKNYLPIPQNDLQKQIVQEYAIFCAQKALERHVGIIKNIYTASGKKRVIIGKDLTKCENIVGTGGPLTRLKKGEDILRFVFSKKYLNKLMPTQNLKFLIDHDYIMASLGILSHKYKKAATKLLLKSLNIDEEDYVSKINN